MKSADFIAKLKNIADKHKTLYVMGGLGAALQGKNVDRYLTNDAYNRKADRQALIKAAANQTPPVFAFDCVNLIKVTLQGWSGDPSPALSYGGAKLWTNGVTDVGADQLIKMCSGVSSDFSKIVPGAAVWLTGHIGVYIGDGRVIECTPSWLNCVQYTALGNIGPIPPLPLRKWTSWGLIPWVTYEAAAHNTPPATPATVTIRPVLKRGDYGPDVKLMQEALTKAGFPCGPCGPDGSFGPATLETIKAFQKDKGLAVDGSCGPVTQRALGLIQ